MLDAVLILARRYPLPFLNEWDESVYRLAREYLQLKGELLGHAPRLHLYEFDQGGYYAALSKESAFELYNADVGDDLARKTSIARCRTTKRSRSRSRSATSGMTPQYSKPIKPQQGLNGTIDVVWCLKLTAREWANEQGHSSPGTASAETARPRAALGAPAAATTRASGPRPRTRSLSAGARSALEGRYSFDLLAHEDTLEERIELSLTGTCNARGSGHAMPFGMRARKIVANALTA